MQVLLSEMCLHLAGGSTRDFVNLRHRFGWRANWFGQADDALVAAGVRESRARRLRALTDPRRARDELRRCEQLGVHLVSWRHPDYPAALRPVPQPPVVLGALGRWPIPERAVALVGSRAATAYGRQATLRLSGAATRAGFAVVSGLARGIDRYALEAALAEGGWPVAVLGCGLDVVYPPEHSQLQQAIAERGTLVSEFPLGQRPDRYAFPRRNRVIAALSRAVVVVEAGQRSGALITAEHALEMGRDVLAVPGPIDSEASRGANRLIFDGAQPVLDEAGLLHLLGAHDAQDAHDAQSNAAGERTDGVADVRAGSATPHAQRAEPRDEQRLLATLGARALALDELSEAAQLDVARTRAGLIALELDGRVRRLEGGRYARSP